MRYKLIIFIFFSFSVFGQVSKKDFDAVPPVAEIVQPEPTVVSIGKKVFTLKDFTQLYKRNLQTDTIPDKSPQQFLEQFIISQLKISKAETDGIDTTTAFKEEIATIKKELSASFLVEKSVNDALIKEAYERLETEVNVSHILISLNEFAEPEDTLLAYNKIIEIRDRILNGEKFNELALKYSNDGSVAKDEGNLGYISAFQTLYPFESACYNTPVGKISLPFRTNYGYHIIKVVAKREYQRWKAAHIFVSLKPNTIEPDQEAAKRKIDEVYNKLQNGENFEKLVKQYSEDLTTNSKGGVFKRLFGTDELEKPFEEALFSLKKNGSYSSPIRTSKGWHIVRLIEKQELKPYSEMYNYLQNKVSADGRSELGKKNLLLRIKKENAFVEFQSVINESKNLIDSLLTNKLPLKNIKSDLLNKTIFTIGQKEISAKKYIDFGAEIWASLKKPYHKKLPEIWYKEFESAENLVFEEEVLPKKSNEFGMLMNEYREGILIQNISDGSVWSNIIQDTTAQRKYFDKNIAEYLLPERIKAEIYDANSMVTLDKIKQLFSKSPYLLNFKWNDLIFGKNQSEILENHKLHLSDLALLMLKNMDYKLEISGNIDPEELENISSERAQNVVKYMAKLGITMERIIEKDNSKFQPVSKTDREKNRRVSFSITTTNKQDVVKLHNILKPESLKVYSGYFKKGENKVVDLLKWVPGEQLIEKSGRYIFANIEQVEPVRNMTFLEARGKVIRAIQKSKENEFIGKLKENFPVFVNEDVLKKVTK